MANRYWVGGNGTWNTSSTTNWSATSGGSGGASVPTSADTVYFDDASYATDSLVVTVSGNVSCFNLFCSRVAPKTVTLNSDSSSSISAYGTTISTGAATTTILTGFSGWLNIYGDNSNLTGSAVWPNTLVTSGVDCGLQYSVTTVISELRLNHSSTVTIKNTAYIAKVSNPNIISAGQVTPLIYVAHASNQTADLYVTGSTDCISGLIHFNSLYTGNLYIEPATGSCSMSLGQFTVGWAKSQIQEMILKPLSAGASFTIAGAAVFTDLERNPASSSFSLKIAPSSSIDVTNFLVEGDVSTTIYIESSVSGTRGTINKLGGGTVETNYVEVKDMQPTPDDTWISYTSTNAGNNYQWYFDDFDKPTSNLFFGSHL